MVPQRPAQEWLCCGAWRKAEGSTARTNSCPAELSEPEGTKRKRAEAVKSEKQ